MDRSTFEFVESADIQFVKFWSEIIIGIAGGIARGPIAGEISRALILGTVTWEHILGAIFNGDIINVGGGGKD